MEPLTVSQAEPVVCATGFDAVDGNYVRVDIRGRGGESLKQHQDVEFVQGAVGGADAGRSHLSDGRFLDVDQRDVGPVERLVEARVAQRALRVQVGGGELATRFRGR